MRLFPTAIALGVVADCIVSLLVAVGLLLAGISQDSTQLYIWSLVLGLLAGGFGGFVVAYKAVSSRILNVIAFGMLELFFGVVLGFFLSMPMWFIITSAVLTIPASLVGASLRRVITSS